MIFVCVSSAWLRYSVERRENNSGEGKDHVCFLNTSWRAGTACLYCYRDTARPVSHVLFYLQALLKHNSMGFLRLWATLLENRRMQFSSLLVAV